MYILFISENLLKYVSGFGMIQGILLAWLIYFHPKSDRSVNIFLSLYILFVSLVMSIPFIIQALTWQKSFFIQPMPLLIGPLLYLYVRSFKETITWKKAWPHFILFIIYFPPTYLNVTGMARKFPDTVTVPAEVLQNPVTMILNYTRLAQAVIYYFLARHTLNTYQRSIRQLFSEISQIDLRWGKLLINGNILIVIASVVFFSLILKFPDYFHELLLVNVAIAAPYIYLVTYKGMTQPTIWQIESTTEKQVLEEEMHDAEEIDHKKDLPGNTKSERSTTPGENMNEQVLQIIALMEKEKLYQEPTLTLQQLADKLQIPAYQVSQLINDGLKKNFYDLINGYRVEEAKRLLLDAKNRNFTILSIGFEAGFNSKTTFNTVFKKFTGQTPTEFRDTQNEMIIS